MPQPLPANSRTKSLTRSVRRLLATSLIAVPLLSNAQTTLPPARIETIQKELVAEIDGQQAFIARLVDMVFSFGG